MVTTVIVTQVVTHHRTTAHVVEITVIVLHRHHLLQIATQVEVQRLRLLHQAVQLSDFLGSSNKSQGKRVWGSHPLTLN